MWRPLVLLQLFVVSVLPICDAGARDKKTKDRLYLDERDVLQIEYRVSVDPRLLGSPSLADSTRDWQERLFMDAFEPVLEWADIPMAHVVLEDGDRPQKGEPVLKIHVMRWGQDFSGEIEAVIQVDLHAYGYRYRIGNYRNTEHSPLSPSRDLMDQTYIKSMRESLREGIYDLLPSFEEPPGAGDGAPEE